MLIRWNELKKLPVYSKSGIFLGKITGLELQAESHLVRAYFVRKTFLGSELSIGREQIISITSDKVIVEDAAVKEEAVKKEENLSVRSETIPVSMSEAKN